MTDSPPPPFEYRKWEYELKWEDAQRAWDRLDSPFDKINEAAIKAADAALRAGLLINGGPAVIGSRVYREPCDKGAGVLGW